MSGTSPASGRPAAAAPPAPDLLLLLVRHAEQRTMTMRDAELSARGLSQADRLAARLAQLPLTALVSSPLRRAQQTARAVARRSGLEVEIEPDLEEYRSSDDDRRRRYVEGPARAMEPDADNYAASALAGVRLMPGMRWGAGGGESAESLRTRGVGAVERVIARHPGGVVACIAHGGIINSILGAWTGAHDDMWFVPWHTGISAVLVSGADRIPLTINDASHLAREEDMLHLVAQQVRGGRHE